MIKTFLIDLIIIEKWKPKIFTKETHNPFPKFELVFTPIFSSHCEFYQSQNKILSDIGWNVILH